MMRHLRALRDDPALRAALAANGLATIRARHTCAHRADELLAILGALRASVAFGDGRMRIAFYGSSLLSSYWNGAATYYRGLLSDLARRGHEITFYEPDAFDRQQHRDMEPPDWARGSRLAAKPRRAARRRGRSRGGRRRGQGERCRRLR